MGRKVCVCCSLSCSFASESPGVGFSDGKGAEETCDAEEEARFGVAGEPGGPATKDPENRPSPT